MSARIWLDVLIYGYRELTLDDQALPERNTLNFVSPFVVTDDTADGLTNVTLPEVSVDQDGAVPAIGESTSRVLVSTADPIATWDRISNTHVASNAAIAGTKIAPAFGAQQVTADGSVMLGDDDARRGHLEAFYATTTNNTQTTMTLAHGDAVNGFPVEDDASYGFSGVITARRSDADNESASWRISGTIDRNAGTVAMVGSVTVAADGDDSGAVWTVTADADNTNKTLRVRVTGANSKTIKWTAMLMIVKAKG